MLTRLWGLRWWMMGLLMLGSVINYLTRATLAVAAPTVLKDLDITTQQYSWILSAFQLAIMLQPLCGYVMDSVGLKLGFAIFAIAWSIAVASPDEGSADSNSRKRASANSRSTCSILLVLDRLSITSSSSTVACHDPMNGGVPWPNSDATTQIRWQTGDNQSCWSSGAGPLALQMH